MNDLEWIINFFDYHRSATLKPDIVFIPARFILFIAQSEGMIPNIDNIKDILWASFRINVVEPSAEQSKHRAASIFARKEHQLNIDEVREHLKIRRYTRDNYPLLRRVDKTLSQYSAIKTTKAKMLKRRAVYPTGCRRDNPDFNQ